MDPIQSEKSKEPWREETDMHWACGIVKSTEYNRFSWAINLSLDEEKDTTLQGNIPCHPLVEEVFDISKIVSDSAQGDTDIGQGEGQSFTLTFGDDADPPNIMRCADDDLVAYVPNQLKQKFGATNISTFPFF